MTASGAGCGRGVSPILWPMPKHSASTRAGQLLEIGGKTTRIEEIEGQYMGLLKFTPAAWSAVESLLGELDAPTRDRLDMTGLLRRLLAAQGFPIGTLSAPTANGAKSTIRKTWRCTRAWSAAGELLLEETSDSELKPR